MHYRTRYKLSVVPFVAISFSLIVLGFVAGVARAWEALAGQIWYLPWMVIAVAALVPLTFAVWYAASFVDVRSGHLSLRSTIHVQHVDLRQLVRAEVLGAETTSRRKKYKLTMLLVDADDNQLMLPLNTWRDEELLMAPVLSATVERQVVIKGGHKLVRRFSGLLEQYKTWERQLAA